jgi:hypothetical protein
MPVFEEKLVRYHELEYVFTYKMLRGFRCHVNGPSAAAGVDTAHLSA